MVCGRAAQRPRLASPCFTQQLSKMLGSFLRGAYRASRPLATAAALAGGAGGMAFALSTPDVAAAAIDSIPRDGRPLVYLSPRGKPFDQQKARDWAAGPGLVFFCGRFEGLDERVIEGRDMEEVSLGDFVLAGGEVAAMALIEAVVRLLPGVAGNEASLTEESFEQGLLEHAHYTMPREWEGRPTPDVLLSGDHKRIEEWRANSAKTLTKQRRPDLYAAYSKTPKFQPPETGDEHD